MAEYLAAAEQAVLLNQPILFTNGAPCAFDGPVYHEDGTGIFLLRGIVPTPYHRYAVYDVDYVGNIEIPTGGAVTAIGTAITVNGEVRADSLSIITPAAVAQYGNVNSMATIVVPRGASFSVGIRYAAATDPAVTPTPAINQANGKVRIRLRWA